MRICAISDTHSLHSSITKHLPEADILIHAGDFSRKGKPVEIIDFLNWFESLPYKYKVFIAGNHDFDVQLQPAWFRDEVKGRAPSCIYLEEELIEIEGIKIYGSPWTTWFYDWAFNLKKEPTTLFRLEHNNGYSAEECWDKIPPDTNILVTHGPRYGILDTVREGTRVGDKVLQEKIYRLPELKAHIFGHIHEGGGREQLVKYSFPPQKAITHEVLHVNASICTLDYRPKNKAIVFDI